MAEFLFVLVLMLIVLACGAWVTDVAWPAVERHLAKRIRAELRPGDWLGEGNTRPPTDGPIEQWLTRGAMRARQAICGLQGHHPLLHFEKARLSLQCTSCGHETPGWDLRDRAASEVVAPPRHRSAASLSAHGLH
jgi:hypothetical protein